MVLFLANQSPNVITCGFAMLLLNYNCAAISYMVYMENLSISGSSIDVLAADKKYANDTLSLLFGLVIGQLIFGVFGDVIGRRKSVTLSSLLMILASLATVVHAFQTNMTSFSSALFSIYRLFIGIGAGGLYPLLGAITRESSQDSLVKSSIGLIFGPFGGLGLLLAAIVLLFISLLEVSDTMKWRTFLIVNFTFTLPLLGFEFQEYEDVDLNADGLDIWLKSLNDFIEEMKSLFTSSQQTVFLLFSSFSWFFSDFIHYGNISMQARYIDRLYYDDNHISIRQIAIIGIAASSSFLIGSILSLFVLRHVSALALQLHGFLLSGALYFIIAVLRSKFPRPWFGLIVVCYSCTFVSYGFGPGPTTYMMPSLLFSKTIRSSCNGISASFGKIGAICGVLVASLISFDISGEMATYGSISLIGSSATLVLMIYYFPVDGSKNRRKLKTRNKSKSYQAYDALERYDNLNDHESQNYNAEIPEDENLSESY